MINDDICFDKYNLVTSMRINMNTQGANHVAVIVAHLVKAVKCYSEVTEIVENSLIMLLRELIEIVADNSRLGSIVRDCFGPLIR